MTKRAHGTFRWVGLTLVIATAFATTVATALSSAPPAGAVPASSSTNGYVLLGGDGGIFPFGVPMQGSQGGFASNCAATAAEPNGSCLSLAMTPSGLGYWILNPVTGAIYPFGDAGDYSDPFIFWEHVAPDLVAQSKTIVATPDGKGYWVYSVLAGEGTALPFGDAPWYGDTFNDFPWGTGHPHFAGHPVTMAPTPDGKGYWEVWSDGGVFAYGHAKFYGSTGAIHLTRPIIGITPTADGQGYWLLASDGGVFAFGDAVFAGSTGGRTLAAPIVGMVANPAGPGYWLAAADGGVFAFGGAPYLGALPQFHVKLNRPIVGIAAKRASIV